ncbi:MAG: response regulator [Candidatus Kapabacteria bacterium]|nr:response regulator [Candidatus Kapabacteria bacterium]
MGSDFPFIIIDEDDSRSLTLEKIIIRAFPSIIIQKFTDGLDAIEELRKTDFNGIVISHFNTASLNGLQVLKNIRQEETSKNLYFILVIPEIEKDLPIKAIQSGVDDFIKEPLSLDDIISKLKIAVRTINNQSKIEVLELKKESLTKEIDEIYDKMLNLVITFLQMRYPHYDLMTERIKSSALWIASHYNSEKDLISKLEKAIPLVFVGKLFLRDNQIAAKVTIDGMPKNDDMLKIPEYTRSMLGNLRNYEDVIDIIVHIYENYDGSGFPDKLMSRMIPLASRILRVVIDFEEYVNERKYDKTKIVEMMGYEARRLYDHRIIALMDQYLAETSSRGGVTLEIKVQKNNLTEGMILSRNIITESGLKLLSAGTLLNQESIEKILTITKSDQIVGNIYVRNK